MLIYVAGALSSGKGERTNSQVIVDYIQNVHSMCEAAIALIRKGHAPYVPALDILLGIVGGDLQEVEFRSVGLCFLIVCDAVVIISEGQGVRLEEEIGKELGKPIFYGVEDVPEYKKEKG